MSLSSDTSLTILGDAIHHGTSRRFGIKQDDRLGHMWLLGKTGTGKSTLLKHLILSDLLAGRGFMVVDPHGDLVEAILDLIPAHRIPDTIYFNPVDTAHPLAFNPMDLAGLPAPLVAAGLVGVLKKAWPDFWGPRMEYVLRSSLLTLLGMRGATLLDLHRLLVDAEFRRKVVGLVKDPQLLQFWTKEFGSYTNTFRTEAVSPIVNKTGQYLTSPLVRNIIGQRKSAFSFRTAMDEGRIILANLAKGWIGEDVSALLGSLLVSQLELAALTRVNAETTKRRNFYLYVDEAHLVATRTMVELFPEARKFHLGVILTHQYLDQLEEELRYAVMGNVGTLIVFRLGARDAQELAKEFVPEFGIPDLMNLPAYHIALKLMVDGTTSRPFSAATFSPPSSGSSYRKSIVEESRIRYTRPVAEVEWEIIRGWQTEATGVQQRLGI